MNPLLNYNKADCMDISSVLNKLAEQITSDINEGKNINDAWTGFKTLTYP